MSNIRENQSPLELLMQMAGGYLMSSCLNAVARLQIAELLDDGARSSSDLASATGVLEDNLYRVLRVLAMVGLFSEVAPRVFANTPASALLSAKHPASMRDMVLWATDEFHFDVYRNMLPVLRDGKTGVEHVFALPPFEAILSEPDRAMRFNNAMTNASAILIPAVLEAYDFSGIRTLADIAGGHGYVITAILQKYPEMNGILFDLREVVEGAWERIERLRLTDRIRIESGDFFKDVPVADAYVMKSIIHDWDDERSRVILRNCSRHLPPGGKVILLENVIPPGTEPHPGKTMDIQMMMMVGGRERTAAEFRDLLSGTNLELTYVIPTRSPMSILECRKI